MGKKTMTWRDKRSDRSKGKRAGSRGWQDIAHGIVVPAPLPLAPLKRLLSSDSGQIALPVLCAIVASRRYSSGACTCSSSSATIGQRNMVTTQLMQRQRLQAKSKNTKVKLAVRTTMLPDLEAGATKEKGGKGHDRRQRRQQIGERAA